MISIIISSHNESYFENVSDNISKTIGNHEYEIIQIWNPGLMGISSAYNKGVTKSKFEYLLFIHEDIEFMLIDWGTMLLERLKDEEIGCVGVAGSNYVPFVEVPWWGVPDKNKIYHYFEKTAEGIEEYNSIKSSNKVFGLDGVLIGVRKNVFYKFLFNEKIEGFHGYDLDFTMRVCSEYRNEVIPLSLLHFSKGKLSQQWFYIIEEIRRKIPNNFNQIRDYQVEYFSFKYYIRLLLSFCNSPYQVVTSMIRNYNLKGEGIIFKVKKIFVVIYYLIIIKILKRKIV